MALIHLGFLKPSFTAVRRRKMETERISDWFACVLRGQQRLRMRGRARPCRCCGRRHRLPGDKRLERGGSRAPDPGRATKASGGQRTFSGGKDAVDRTFAQGRPLVTVFTFLCSKVPELRRCCPGASGLACLCSGLWCAARCPHEEDWGKPCNITAGRHVKGPGAL